MNNIEKWLKNETKIEWKF